MPLEDSVRADQEGRPGWSREPAAERCQQQAIATVPARTPGLALEDAKLVAEEEHLRLEAGIGAAADQQEIKEEAKKAVGRPGA